MAYDFLGGMDPDQLAKFQASYKQLRAQVVAAAEAIRLSEPTVYAQVMIFNPIEKRKAAIISLDEMANKIAAGDTAAAARLEPTVKSLVAILADKIPTRRQLMEQAAQATVQDAKNMVKGAGSIAAAAGLEFFKGAWPLVALGVVYLLLRK